MSGAAGFARSVPNAENVGEEWIAVVSGAFGWVVGVAIALFAGWRLARRAQRHRWLLWVLPLVVSVAWMLLARGALYSGWSSSVVERAQPFMDAMSSVSSMLWSTFVRSVYDLAALPISIGLFLAFLVLISVRSIRRTEDNAPTVASA